MLADIVVLAAALVYAAASLALCVFGVNLFVFSWRAWRRGPKVALAAARLAEGELPLVTVQLPIYNELYVSERIIAAVCAFDYPGDRLQIQVLDDSTDETTLIIADVVASARARGVNIVHRHRSCRTGYKAGALGAGLAESTGEFVAIFDADFVPAPDFLRRTLPHFDAPNIAFVQARWGHLNRDHSWLTRLQALAIDGHFLVEQSGRGDAGYWFNFNGTAGVWRAAAIHDAGGWRADTLTEDLDLSYRAHLRGWKGAYLEDVVVPAEVPAQLTGFRRQQHRWARGSLECAARLLPAVWKSGASRVTRLQASLHLCAYSIQLLLLTLLLIYPVVVVADVEYPWFGTLFGLGYLLALTSLAPTVFFVTGSRQGGRRWVRDLPSILLVTAFGAGLMVNTARAALQIFTRPNPSFERTAKFGLSNETGGGATGAASGPGDGTGSGSWKLKRYQLDADRIVYAEIGLALYAAGSAWLAARNHSWGVFVYASIFALGLSLVAGSTLVDSWLLHRSRRSRHDALRAEQRAFAVATGRFEATRGPDRRNTELVTNEPAGVKRAVVVMAKRPAAGITKTRLSPALSGEQAAALYERFLIDTLAAINERTDATLVVAIDSPDAAAYFSALAPDVAQVEQIGASLGERLDRVLTACLELGFDEVYALGSDSPDLPSGHLDAAFASLGSAEVDIVLGPTEDGGYYLIGWKQRWKPVVAEVTMSTPSVLADTLDVADRVGARVALAPPWYDVDHPDDLDRLRTSLAGEPDSETADFLATL